MASTCLETLFSLISVHTRCKASTDEPQRFFLRWDRRKI